MSAKYILVTGAGGQLGQSLNWVSDEFPDLRFYFATRTEADLGNTATIVELTNKHQFTHCINCAAYTGVDKAESEKEIAIDINGEAVGRLAELSNQKNIQLFHISTDYVFNGTSSTPYNPESKTDPVNFYGETKLLGEQLALKNCNQTIVIRTSWVYSFYGHNFVKTMLRLMKEKSEISVVNDQFGSPTSAIDLARAILQLIQNDKEAAAGIYHYCNAGIISWFEFAQQIKTFSKLNCVVHPVPSTQYPTPAKRPAYSALDTSKIAGFLPAPIPEWSVSLQECLDLMKAN